MTDDTPNGAIKQATTALKLDYLIDQVAAVARSLADFQRDVAERGRENDARLRVLEQIASGAPGLTSNMGDLEKRVISLEIATARLGERVTDGDRWGVLGNLAAAVAGILLKSPLP